MHIPPWLLFALLSVGFATTYGLISKKMLNNDDDHDPIAYASSLFSVVAVCSLIAYLFTGLQTSDLAVFTKPDVLILLAANLFFYTVAPSFYWRALKHLPASEVSILYDLTTVYIFIFGVKVGTEMFSTTRMLGGLLIVSASILLGWYTQKKNSFRVNRYFVMLMISTILYAFAALTDNAIIARGYLSPLFFQTLSFGIPSLLVLLINHRSIPHLKRIYQPRVYKFVLLNGLFFFGSFWSIYHAYAVGGVTSEVNFAISSETILTVILASLLLKEREHMYLKIICGVLVTLGVFLLS